MEIYKYTKFHQNWMQKANGHRLGSSEFCAKKTENSARRFCEF